MFQKLTDFGFQRTPKQALGFYIAWFVILVLFGAIVGGVVGMLSGDSQEVFQQGLKVGTSLSVICCLVLATLVVRAKKLLNSFTYIILILVAGALALFGGALLGLIPVAYITTKK